MFPKICWLMRFFFCSSPLQAVAAAVAAVVAAAAGVLAALEMVAVGAVVSAGPAAA